MSYATLILGEPGTGKTCSIRNLDPKKTLLIQPIRKPLPFRSRGWKEIRQKGDGGNIFVCDQAHLIVKAMTKATQDVIIVDDWTFILTNMFMARSAEKGYQKFTDMAAAGNSVIRTASELAPEKRVYIMGHTTKGEDEVVRIKTVGRLLDEKLVPEARFSIVLRTHVDRANGRYTFLTHNSGFDTVKTPIGLFDNDEIDNDLAAVDRAICDFYEIPHEQPDENTPRESHPAS